MPANTWLTKLLLTSPTEIEKNEWLHQLAYVGGADHPDDRPVRLAVRAEDDATALSRNMTPPLPRSVRPRLSARVSARRKLTR